MARRKSEAEALYGYAGTASGMAAVLDEAGYEEEARLAEKLSEKLTRRAQEAEKK